MTDTQTFEVVWDDPADADLSWSRDVVHAPEPLRPLSGQFATFVAHGLTKTMEEYSLPVAANKFRVINGYLYSTMVLMDVSPDELLRLAEQAQGKIGGLMGQLGDLWTNTYLPEIKELLDELEAFDLDGAGIDELIAHFERVLAVGLRLFEIHFLILMPSMLAVSEFDELYRGLLKTDDPYAAYRLLQGLDNKTLETGRALFELSRKARDVPEVYEAIESNTGLAVLDSLKETAAGRRFLGQLDAYLAEYGQRGDKWDTSYPSWIEDPTPVINNLKEYVQQDAHPAADLEQGAAEAERLIAQAREDLAQDPMLPIFDFLLKAAREGIVISEDHGFWIDFRGGHRFRMACLAFGRRFARAGVIDESNDVFYLFHDELIETAEQLPSLDRRDLIARRNAEREAFASMKPPDVVGAPVPESSPVDENPMARAFAKFFGAKHASKDADEICGNPGSPGRARGTARIIATIADADRLEPGDILVAETTSPPWTPLFAFASAVVTDSGGILSHCAVVAREYGIPAVVGCGDATAKITDGQTVEVDGTTGVVRVIV